MKELLVKIDKQIFFYRQDLKPIIRFAVVVMALFTAFAVMNLYWQGGLSGETKPLDTVTSFQTLDLATLDGGRFTAEDFIDYDLIVVDVWATWCPHCVEEMPAMASFSDSLEDLFPDHKVLYMGICTDIVDRNGKTDGALLKVAKDTSVNADVHYPQLIADKSFNEAFSNLYATALPAIFYLTGNGTIVHHSGGLSETGYALQISQLLDAQ